MSEFNRCPSLSLVIPCRNEAKRLPRTLEVLRDYLDNTPQPTDIEILFSIEKSQDTTTDIVREKMAGDKCVSILEHAEARGKGFNVRQGILAARGECILFMDADLSIPLRFISEFLKQFVSRPDLDVLIGSRRHPKSLCLKPQSLMRRLGGKAISLAIKTFAATPWADTQCGFKAFRRRAAHQIFSGTLLDGFSFDFEVLALAQGMRMNVDEYPVEWHDVAGSSVQPFRDGLAIIRDAVGVQRIIRDTLRCRPLNESE